MKTAVRLTLFVTIVAFLAGCSLIGLKTWADLTPKQKAIFFMNTYTSTANNVDALLKDPMVTPVVKASAMKDKATLAQVYPLIQSYKVWAATGVMGVPVSEDMILKLIDQLVNKL
jgi:hypothetical protein